MSDDVQAHYSGMEPVDIENLDSVREERSVIPAAKGVKVKIVKAENQINKDNTYRQISLQLRLVEGIGEEGKYKNKPIFSRVCYYADPEAYTKDFFKKRQHLVQLKYLLKATGIEGGKVDGHTLDALMAAPFITVDITVRKRTIAPTDGSEPYDVQENEARNYKAVPVEEQV